MYAAARSGGAQPRLENANGPTSSRATGLVGPFASEVAMTIQTKMTVYDLADAAIGMFLEYRDVHGRTEDQARLEAASEIQQGVDAEQELRAAGEIH
jgi:hypothetical protein